MPFRLNRCRIATWSGLTLLLLSVVGCAPPPGTHYRLDTLSPRSALTQRFYDIFVEVTVIDIIVLIIVVAIFVLALMVFSTRTGEPTEFSWRTDVFLETAWIVIPMILVIAIAIPTVKTIIETQPYTWSPDTLEVRVIAHQWWWEFRYPSTGVVTADEVHIPVNRQINFAMVSRDVIHSFFMPALGGKRDVVPGQENHITLTANTPGEYWGQCTEFCGDSHANMRFRVFVDTPEQFDAWTKHQLSAPVHPTEGLAAEGAKIFADAPCAVCHTVRGISGLSPQYTYGFRGPDLTHFGSRGTIAGAIMDNTPENLALWIHNPDAVKPGANMPTLGLSGHDLNALVAYLESLK
ncbi:MAG TPA: cytochrome c oxidase subunit II [Candidatus Binataceae bacterium]|nr:cytochrome c oxidase subunit II [Candidatus Binataceae bacterium]